MDNSKEIIEQNTKEIVFLKSEIDSLKIDIENLNNKLIGVETLISKTSQKEECPRKFIRIMDSLYLDKTLGMTHKEKLIVSGFKLTTNYKVLAAYLNCSEPSVYEIIHRLRGKKRLSGFTPTFKLGGKSYSNIPVDVFKQFNLNLVEANLYWKLLMRTTDEGNCFHVKEVKEFIGVTDKTFRNKIKLLMDLKLVERRSHNFDSLKIIDYRYI